MKILRTTYVNGILPPELFIHCTIFKYLEWSLEWEWILTISVSTPPLLLLRNFRFLATKHSKIETSIQIWVKKLMSGKFCFATINLRFLDKAKIYAATLKRQFPIHVLGKYSNLYFRKEWGVEWGIHSFLNSKGVEEWISLLFSQRSWSWISLQK